MKNQNDESEVDPMMPTDITPSEESDGKPANVPGRLNQPYVETPEPGVQEPLSPTEFKHR